MSDYAFKKSLLLDELFDLALYREFAKIAEGDTKKILQELIPIEEKHFAFWQEILGEKKCVLSWNRRIWLWFLKTLGCFGGDFVLQLILEATEVYGIKKHLTLWKIYKGTPFGEKIHEILEDEFRHEDAVVSKLAGKSIKPERIRNIFLGLNDGLVEITGAVSGFFAAFQDPETVLIAGVTVAFAGSLSMGAGVYVAVSSEEEVRGIEREKKRFLRGEESVDGQNSFLSGILVGASYFLGALVPVLPLVLGAGNIWFSVGAALCTSLLVSFVLALLSGMNIRRRIAINISLVLLAMGVTYLVGTFAQSQWGIVL